MNATFTTTITTAAHWTLARLDTVGQDVKDALRTAVPQPHRDQYEVSFPSREAFNESMAALRDNVRSARPVEPSAEDMAEARRVLRGQ